MKKHPLITGIVVLAVVFALIWIATHPAPMTPLAGGRSGSITRLSGPIDVLNSSTTRGE